MLLELANVELDGGEFLVRALDLVLLAARARLLAVALDLLGPTAQTGGVDLETLEVVGDAHGGGGRGMVGLGYVGR